MKRLNLTSPPVQFATWSVSVVLVGAAGFSLVGFFYQEHMDYSNPELHESANTWLGWTVAILSSTRSPTNNPT